MRASIQGPGDILAAMDTDDRVHDQYMDGEQICDTSKDKIIGKYSMWLSLITMEH